MIAERTRFSPSSAVSSAAACHGYMSVTPCRLYAATAHGGSPHALSRWRSCRGTCGRGAIAAVASHRPDGDDDDAGG